MKTNTDDGGEEMPGKATKPDDGRRNNRGGYRGGGRPVGSTSPRGQRGIHQIRAYEDEWELIKDFIQLVRKDIDKCRLTTTLLKNDIEKYS